MKYGCKIKIIIHPPELLYPLQHTENTGFTLFTSSIALDILNRSPSGKLRTVEKWSSSCKGKTLNHFACLCLHQRCRSMDRRGLPQPSLYDYRDGCGWIWIPVFCRSNLRSAIADCQAGHWWYKIPGRACPGRFCLKGGLDSRNFPK